MKPNLGQIDSTVRTIVGIALVLISIIPNPIVSSLLPRIIVGVVAVILVSTGLLKFCPLYKIAGLSTRSESE